VSSVSVAHRDSRIEGLEGTRGGLARDRVMVVGVDSVTDDSNDVVGSDSGRPMSEGLGRDDVLGSESGRLIDEGPGRDGGIDLIIDLTDSAEGAGRTGTTAGGSGSDSALNSVCRTDGLDTDSGSRVCLAIIVVESDGMLSISEGELVEERSSG
jgi:hypothetical protein